MPNMWKIARLEYRVKPYEEAWPLFLVLFNSISIRIPFTSFDFRKYNVTHWRDC